MTACEEDDGDADDDQEKVEEEWEEDDKDVWGHGVTLCVMCCVTAQQHNNVVMYVACTLWSLHSGRAIVHPPPATWCSIKPLVHTVTF